MINLSSVEELFVLTPGHSDVSVFVYFSKHVVRNYHSHQNGIRGQIWFANGGKEDMGLCLFVLYIFDRCKVLLHC